MTAQISQVITGLPTAPDFNTDTPEVFSLKAVASVLAQQGLPPEINAFSTQANVLAVDVNANAQIATAAKIAAEAAVAIAQNAAAVAQSTTGATTYVPNQAYSLNQSVISPLDQKVYRKRTATSSSAADPKDDPTNWLNVQGEALPLAGGTMTGPVTLAADPVAPMQPTTLQYVENNFVSLAQMHAAMLSF
ncbi:hypothetical protein [Massilia eurypsychrophila]